MNYYIGITIFKEKKYNFYFTDNEEFSLLVKLLNEYLTENISENIKSIKLEYLDKSNIKIITNNDLNSIGGYINQIEITKEFVESIQNNNKYIKYEFD